MVIAEQLIIHSTNTWFLCRSCNWFKKPLIQWVLLNIYTTQNCPKRLGMVLLVPEMADLNGGSGWRPDYVFYIHSGTCTTQVPRGGERLTYLLEEVIMSSYLYHKWRHVLRAIWWNKLCIGFMSIIWSHAAVDSAVLWSLHFIEYQWSTQYILVLFLKPVFRLGPPSLSNF